MNKTNPYFIFVINGPGGSGKDEFIKFVKTHTSLSILNVSTVDPIKMAAKDLGWDGTKTEDNRKFLSDLKDLCTKHFDTSYNYIKRIIEYANKSKFPIVFIHCREPQEIQRLVDDFGAKTILVDASKRVKTIISNHADAEAANYSYDIVINNNGTLQNLEDIAVSFAMTIERRIKNGE